MKTLVEHALHDAFLRTIEFPLQVPLIIIPTSNEDAYLFFGFNLLSETTCSFLNRIHSNARCSDSVIICALILLDRVAARDPRLIITPFTGSRLLITALLIATKFNQEEEPSDNLYYATLGGIGFPTEINSLEIAMLRILNYEAFVSYEDFQSKLRFCVNRMGFELTGSDPPETDIAIPEKN